MYHFLRINRTSAVKYLQSMQERYSSQVSKNLTQAIEKYNQIIEFANYKKITEESNKTLVGRRALIGEIHKVIELELDAASALEEAVKSME